MIYLLDTHILLWSLFQPNNIPTATRNILENDSDTKCLSGVNLWEISLKFSLGKLALGGLTPDIIFDTFLTAGYEVLAIENDLLATYYKLPKKPDHRDPFDRLLIWQAISHDYVLMTQNEKFDHYRVDGLKIYRSTA